MAIIDAIKKRYSCRVYKDKPIEKQKLDEILEAGRLAPSAKNLQDWRFVVVTDKKMIAKIAEAANNQTFLRGAGAIIIACSNNDYVMRCGQKIAPIDIAIALEHIALQAAELGIGTCWIGSFFPEKVRALLNIPQDIEIVELMGMGYPADKPKKHDRVPLENIVCYERWQF